MSTPPKPSVLTAPSLLMSSPPTIERFERLDIPQELVTYFREFAEFVLDAETILNITQLLVAAPTEAADILHGSEKYHAFTLQFRSLCRHIAHNTDISRHLLILAHDIPTEIWAEEVAILKSTLPPPLESFCSFLVEVTLSAFSRFHEGFTLHTKGIAFRILLNKIFLSIVVEHQATCRKLQRHLVQCTEQIRSSPHSAVASPPVQRDAPARSLQTLTVDPVKLTPEQQSFFETLAACALKKKVIKELQKPLPTEAKSAAALFLKLAASNGTFLELPAKIKKHAMPLLRLITERADTLALQDDTSIRTWRANLADVEFGLPPHVADFCTLLVETSLTLYRKFQDKTHKLTEKKFVIFQGLLKQIFLPIAKKHEQKCQKLHDVICQTLGHLRPALPSERFVQLNVYESAPSKKPEALQLPPDGLEFFHNIAQCTLDDFTLDKLLYWLMQPQQQAQDFFLQVGSDGGWSIPFRSLCSLMPHATGLVRLLSLHANHVETKDDKLRAAWLRKAGKLQDPFCCFLVELSLQILLTPYGGSLHVISFQEAAIYRAILTEVYHPVAAQYEDACPIPSDKLKDFTSVLQVLVSSGILESNLDSLDQDSLDLLYQSLENEAEQNTIRGGKWQHLIGVYPHSAPILKNIFEYLAQLDDRFYATAVQSLREFIQKQRLL